jgi:hypothetical protein
MPKILINEVDKTSAGTPGRYGNYAVLLTGYQKEFSDVEITTANNEIKAYDEAVAAREAGDTSVKPTPLSATAQMLKAREAQIDSNGVYEFNSVSDFEKTIGLTETDRKTGHGDTVESHYGNRMAYELLKLGYQVIYKVISTVSDMADFDECWAIFKDKASYDFRFVSHGLINSCDDPTAYANLLAKKERIEADLVILSNIENSANDELERSEIKLDVDFIEKCEELFDSSNHEFLGFDESLPFGNYMTAAGIKKDTDGITYIKDPTEGLAGELIQADEAITNHMSVHFTNTEFNKINGHIASLASYRMDKAATTVLNDGRGDCVALIELDENSYCVVNSDQRPEELIINEINVMSTDIGDNGAYSALTVPSVYYANGMKLPGAFHYLACFMNSLSSGFAEWYAAAGYNRGVSSLAIDHTSVKLGEIAINALEPRNLVDDENKLQPIFACNVIASFRGSYYLWGNRTAARLGSAAGGDDLTAEHFLNIRQLCSTIKKQLYVACRRFTFDPNSDTLWFNFVNAITPTLDAMKADQGIRDYKVVKVFTDKKATLKARIRIIPIEAVEDFDITVALEDSFGGVSVTAEG